VQRFVQNLNIAKSTYIFAIANCGSSIGKTLVQLQQELQSNSYTLSAGFKIKMPGNYTPMYGALATEKQNKLFQAAEQEISKIIPVIKTKKQLPIPTGVFPLAQISNWLYKISLPRFAKLDKDFLVTESCNGCQICEKICPVQNIKMQNHKPTWSGNCEQCLGCLQWCPQTAIEFGKSTLNKKRYHHPQIKITELYSR
jgi:ferredoxin